VLSQQSDSIKDWTIKAQ